MSAFPAVGPGLTAASGIVQMINPIDAFFNVLSTNPYFIGLMMLLLNLGGRFLGMEMSKEQEKFFQQVWVRRALVFTVLFIATRNILAALFLTVIVLLLLSFLFNENSDLYLGEKTMVSSVDSVPSPGLTPEESEILRRLNDKQVKWMKSVEAQTSDSAKQKTENSVEQIYNSNLSFLESVITGRTA
jgi:hypothetical protein